MAEDHYLEKYEELCSENKIQSLSLTRIEKIKLIQMILMLEKLYFNDLDRFQSTVKRMGLEKLIENLSSFNLRDQVDKIETNSMNSEKSEKTEKLEIVRMRNIRNIIFCAVITLYGVSIKKSPLEKINSKTQLRNEHNLFDLLKNGQWNLAQELLRTKPEVAKILDPTFGLPLHFICSQSMTLLPPVELVHRLCESFESGVVTLNPLGHYPLHLWLLKFYEIQRSCPNLDWIRTWEDIFHAILQKDPRVASFQSTAPASSSLTYFLPLLSTSHPFHTFSGDTFWNGMLPLHIASRLSSAIPVSIFRSLFAAYPKGATEYDANGLMPLHWALISPQLSQEILITLISLSSEAALLTEEIFGALPLHLACMTREIPTTVIISLLDLFPRACSLEDRNGFLPLHHACSALLEYDVIQKLIQEYPSGSGQIVVTDDTLPLHLYLSNGGKDLKLITLLVQSDLPQEQKDDEIYVASSGRSWLYLVSSVSDANHTPLLLPVIELIISAIFHLDGVRGIYRLAYLQNEYNVPVIEACPFHVQRLFHQYLLFCNRYFIVSSSPVFQNSYSMVVTAYDYESSINYQKCFQTCLQEKFDERSEISSLGESFDEDSSPLKQPSLDFEDPNKKGMNSITEFTNFIHMVGIELSHGDKKTDEGAILQLFSKLKDPHTGRITEEAVRRYCESYFGNPRKVQLKFLENSQQREYESHIREKLSFDHSSHIVKLLDVPNPDTLSQGLIEFFHPTLNLGNYKTLLSLPDYDTNLDMIFRNEQPSYRQVQQLMKSVAQGLYDCHEKGIIHGNLTMKCILRIKSSFYVSDFYYFDEGNEREYHHADDFETNHPEKHDFLTTGYLPPECFVWVHNKHSPGGSLRISTDSSFEKTQRLSWLSDEARSETSTQRSHRYHVLSPKKYYFRKENETQTTQLNIGQDIWSFGVILYALLSGEHLFPVNRDENLARSFQENYSGPFTSLTPIEIDNKLKKHIHNLIGYNLLLQLLQPNPIQRNAISFHEILKHPFFQNHSTTIHPRNESNFPEPTLPHSQKSIPPLTPLLNIPYQFVLPQHESIQVGQTTSTKYLSRKYKAVKSFPIDVLAYIKMLNIHHLRNSRVGLQSSYHPTSFIILNRKLTSLRSLSLEDDRSTSPTPTIGVLPDVPPLILSRVQRWINKLYNYFALIDGYDSSHSHPNVSLDNEILLAMNEICNENELYLYLVDEITLEPIDSFSFDDSTSPQSPSQSQPLFPMMITHPSSFLPLIMPLLRETYKMICQSRFRENIGHCFGYPLDIIPVQWIPMVEIIVGSTEKEERLQQLTNWKNFVSKNIGMNFFFENGQEVNPLLAALHALTKFLDENDPYQLWCGLQKIYLSEDIHCWTKEKITDFIQTGTELNSETKDLNGSSRPNSPPPTQPRKEMSEGPRKEIEKISPSSTALPPLRKEKQSNPSSTLAYAVPSAPIPPKPESILRSPQAESPSISMMKRVGFLDEHSDREESPLGDISSKRDPISPAISRSPSMGALSTAPTPVRYKPFIKGRIYKEPTSRSANRSFNIMKKWTKRFMILESVTYTLKYGVSEAALCSSNGIKGSIQLQVGMTCIEGKKKNSFELFYQNSCLLRAVAETEEERDNWIEAITVVISYIAEA